MSITHTVHQLPPRMRKRADAVESSVRAFLADVTAATQRGMHQRLSGGGAPGAYPVPRRSPGGLRDSTGVDAPRRTARGWDAVVFNEAPYARAVHEGFRAYGNPNAPYYGARRFLTDALAQVDPAARLQAWLARAE